MMRTPETKRHEYWNHFIAKWALDKIGGSGITGPRLRKIKTAIITDDHFWWDVVNRHGGLEVTPEQMAIQYPAQYEHAMGNFWGMVMQNLVETGILR